MTARTTLIHIFVAPGFNMHAVTAFLDPLRAANYLVAEPVFRWRIVAAQDGSVKASNGLSLSAEALDSSNVPGIGVIATSWSPEDSCGAPLDRHLRRWDRAGAHLVGLDTGAYVLAHNGLLNGYRVTVHYEHMDSFSERFPDIEMAENLYVIDGKRMTCCGGQAATDLSLHLVRQELGDGLANAAARYIFHGRLREEAEMQNPGAAEPLGGTAPTPLRDAIQIMERHLEEPLTIPKLCAKVGASQRQLERLFRQYVGKSPVMYYRDIRLDRARGLVTQTEMPLAEIAVASGFSGPVPFSRAYRARFGLAPSKDRASSRVPFEFRAWPMFQGASSRA